MLGHLQPYLLSEGISWTDADAFDSGLNYGYEGVSCPPPNRSSRDFCQVFNDALFATIARQLNPPEKRAENQGFFIAGDMNHIHVRSSLQ